MKTTFETNVSSGYFYLFADCKPVKGYKNSAIYDLGRGDIHLFPTSYYDILLELKSYPINEIHEAFEEESDKGNFYNFLQFLHEKSLGVIVKDITAFPEIDTTWDHPSPITNAIIDVGEKQHDFVSLFKQLDGLFVRDIQLRFYTSITFDELLDILHAVEATEFKSVEVICPYHNSFTARRMDKLFNEVYRVTDLHLFNSVKNEIVFPPLAKIVGRGRIIYSIKNITSCEACGIINKKNLTTPSIEQFNENLHFNGCLNRKISIDVNGDIKNCPSMQNKFGNISNTKLKNVAEMAEFKKLWSVKKDQISVCKDCEYRYSCSDCRAYLQEEGDPYSKPLKCKYDPYTATWGN